MASSGAPLGDLVFHSEVDAFEPWKDALQARLPALRVVRSDALTDPQAVHHALVWNPPEGFFARMTRLRLIVNLGAGVDALVNRRDLPPGVPVTRISDPDMARMMAGYVLFAVLRHARDMPHFEAAQRRGVWSYRHPRTPDAVHVVVLGLGQLGARAASELQRLGYRVSGWSRKPASIEGVACHAGAAALDPLLAGADILVVMLPLTPDTRGLLDRERLAQLPNGAAIVNVARGAIVDQAALTELLRSGHLGGATLDVFETEPLPPGDPLWTLPGVLVTPHLASIAIPTSASAQIAENIVRVERGEAPLNVVDPKRGY